MSVNFFSEKQKQNLKNMQLYSRDRISVSVNNHNIM